jgi:hypothetical protein
MAGNSVSEQVVADYFDERMLNRQRLMWTIATRRQLERWEPLVAAFVRAKSTGGLVDADVWAAQAEHHFALVPAHHLFLALDLDPPLRVPGDDAELRAEVKQGRDLHEHWVENMPVFNVRPLVAEPGHKSGRDFAARNPDRGPYWWLGWNNKTGAMLLPHVSSPALHRLLDSVEAEVLAGDPALSRFLPRRVRSPWLHEGGEWWPKADEPEDDRLPLPGG